jgi:hypothetical protein
MQLDQFEFSMLEQHRDHLNKARSEIHDLRQLMMGNAEQLFLQARMLRKIAVILVISNLATIGMCSVFLITYSLKK